MRILNIDVRLIRGIYHAARKIGNRWVVKKFDHYPTTEELEAAFS